MSQKTSNSGKYWEIIDSADGEIVATTTSEEKAEEFRDFGNVWVAREVEE